jgi:hypothetical protein
MSRSLRLALAVVVGAAALAAPSSAAELQKKSIELGLSALIQDADQSGLYLNVATRVGYMITTHHEAGVIASVLWVKPDSQGNIFASSLGAFYRYNFATTGDHMVPFLGASSYSYQGDLRQSLRWGWTIESGLRYLPTPAAAIVATLVWRREFAASGYAVTERSFGMTVGFSLFF